MTDLVPLALRILHALGIHVDPYCRGNIQCLPMLARGTHTPVARVVTPMTDFVPLPPAEVATTCDECAASIAYGETCYAVPDGRTHDDLPVVRILCAACHD